MALLADAHVVLIVNPAARRGRRIRARVVAALAAGTGRLTVHETEGPGHATALARAQAGHAAAVFSLGGDGTVREVAEGLVGTGTALGPLPGGTGNLVCRALGIPLAPRRAVRALLEGAVRPIDVGRLADGSMVTFAAGAGIDAAMIAGATAERKRRWGVATYVVTGARAAFGRQAFRLRATVDGVTIEREAWAVFAANFGDVLGGLLQLGPGVRPDDGAFDLCVYSPRHVRDAFALAWRMLRHDFRPDARMTFLRGREIVVETTPLRPVQCDGELTGTTPLRLRVEPRALMVLAPSRAR